MSSRNEEPQSVNQSEDMLKRCLLAGNMGAFQVDLITSRVNRFGPVTEALGLTDNTEDFLANIHPDDLQTFLQINKSRTPVDPTYELTYRYIKPDGTCEWVRENAEVLFDDERVAVGVTGIYQIVTSQKQAENELRSKDFFTSAVFESSPDCVKVLDPEGRVLQINGSGRTLMEIDDFASVCGKEYWTIWPEESRESVREAFEEARQHGEGRLEGSCPTAGGTPKWWNVVIRPVFDEAGELTNFVAVTRDITDSRAREQELAAGKQQLELLLSSTAEGIYGIDLDGNCTFANAACVELFGYESAEDLLGKHMHELVHHTRSDGSPYPNEECHIYQAYREGRQVHVDDEVFWRADGTCFDAEYWSHPQIDDGKPVGCVVTFLDISERRRWQTQLADSEARLRSVIEGATGFFGVLTPDGILIECNQISYQSAGIKREDAVGKPFWETAWWNFDPEVSARVKDMVNRAAAGETVQEDLRFFTADGSIRQVATTFNPVYDNDGNLIFIVPSGADITERLEQARQLAETNIRLELSLAVSGSAVWSWDTESNQPIPNASLSRMFGFAETDSPSLEDFLARMHDDDRERVAVSIGRAIETGTPYEEEYRVKLPSGETRWLHAVGTAQRSDRGGLDDFFGVISDCTDRKQREVELAENEARLRRVIDNMLNFVGVLDRDGVLLEVNRTALLAGGVERGDVVGKLFWDCYWWNFDEEVVSRLQGAVREAQSGATIRYDETVRMANDTHIVIDFMLVPVSDEGGHITHLIPSGVDISERKAAEIALKNSEERLKLGIEVAQFGLVHIDYRTDMAELSLEAAQMFGLGDQAMTASRSDLHATFHPDDADELHLAIEESLNSGEDRLLSVEHRIVLPKGGERWLDVRKQIFFDQTCNPPQPAHASLAVRDITRRKQFQAELSENSMRLRMALKSGGMAAWEWAPEESFWEPRLYDLLGISRDQVASTELFYESVHPDDLQMLKEGWEKATDGGDRYDELFRIIRPDGEIRWLRAVGEIIRSSDGEVEKIFGLNWDETEERAASAELAENRRQLALAMKSAKMGSFIWNSETDEANLDEEWCAAVGLSHNAGRSGENFYRMIHPDDRELMRDITERSRVGEIDFSVEFRIIRPDGGVRWMAGIGSWIPVEDGLPVQLSGLNWDITERKEFENEIRLNEERLRIAAQTAGFGHFQIEPETGKVHWSAEMKVILGLPADHEPSYHAGEVPDFVHPDDRQSFAELTERVLNDLENTDYSHDHRIVRPDGETRHVRMQQRLIFEGKGENRRLRMIIGTLLDITQQREYEAMLEQERQFAQAANDAKTEFVANMSHEIRTPMTAVLGYTDLLFANETDPAKIEHLRTIQRNGHFLLEIINDILDLSKIEAGKMDIAKESFAPHWLVADVRSMMQVRAGEKGLNFSVTYEGPVPATIVSDSRRLKQILVNLIGNAIKFTETGSIDLKVRFIDSDRPHLQFDISDTGVGMTKKQQRGLFQPFTQGDMSVSREFGGTGLGLAISRRLTEMLGGEIEVTSEPGVGSTFTFSIDPGPVDRDQFIEPVDHDIAESESNSVVLPKLNCRALVVDDCEDIRELACEILRSAGADVEQADDGQAALMIIQEALDSRNNIPDVILLDMQMPRLDGYQTAEKLRAIGYRSPIIAVTADAMQGNMTRCMESGCDAYLSKPVNRRALLESIQNHLDQKTEDGNPDVVIIEDSQDAAEALQELLKLRNISSVIANTGGEGIAKACQHRPRVIILDLTLPDMSGYDVVGKLRAMDDLAGTIYIALTGRTDPKDVQQCKEAGFDYHMGKPVDLRSLWELIKQVLG
ncbi:MAG: PAS domain S-box protein [Verrucomicrobiales bacterium]|nr:PAS domain S-box protein [Verrucomicrobiales bacterium]